MNASERMSENNYYLESNKTNNNTPERSFPNDKVRQSRRDSTESIAGQSPTLTDSQQMKLNHILHTGKLTNCNISSFSDYEFADSSFVEDVLDDSPETRLSMRSEIPEIEKGCCYLI